MNSRGLDKIRLCLNEMLMIRQLLEKKVADDFCCRLCASINTKVVNAFVTWALMRCGF